MVVQCHTDLSTCGQGPHRGDWYFPNGSRLGFSGGTTRLPFSGDIYEARRTQRVDLRRSNNANSPVGIYCCDIPTIAVNDRIGYNSVRATVYVGLYTASGGMFHKLAMMKPILVSP